MHLHQNSEPAGRIAKKTRVQGGGQSSPHWWTHFHPTSEPGPIAKMAPTQGRTHFHPTAATGNRAQAATPQKWTNAQTDGNKQQTEPNILQSSPRPSSRPSTKPSATHKGDSPPDSDSSLASDSGQDDDGSHYTYPHNATSRPTPNYSDDDTDSNNSRYRSVTQCDMTAPGTLVHLLQSVYHRQPASAEDNANHILRWLHIIMDKPEKFNQALTHN